MSRDRRIPQFTIDLTQADGYSVVEYDVLRAALEKRSLWGSEFGYSAFAPQLKARVLASGTYYDPQGKNPDQMFLCTLDEKLQITDDGNSEYDLMHYLTVNGDISVGMFVVYHLALLKPEKYSINPYIFIDPENKLLAVAGLATVKF